MPRSPKGRTPLTTRTRNDRRKGQKGAFSRKVAEGETLGRDLHKTPGVNCEPPGTVPGVPVSVRLPLPCCDPVPACPVVVHFLPIFRAFVVWVVSLYPYAKICPLKRKIKGYFQPHNQKQQKTALFRGGFTGFMWFICSARYKHSVLDDPGKQSDKSQTGAIFPPLEILLYFGCPGRLRFSMLLYNHSYILLPSVTIPGSGVALR